MAIVINNAPGSYFSVNGDLIWVVYEATKANDPSTYPGYRYLADVYVSGVLVASIRKVPQPDNKRGVFNLSDVIRNYLTINFNTAVSIRAQQMGLAEFFTSVQIKFGEEYGFTTYPDVTVDSTRTFFNNYNGRMLGTQTNLSSYLNKPLSNRPVVNSILSNSENVFIPYLPTSTGSVVLTIVSNNGTITPSFTPSGANVLQQFDVSPERLNAYSAGFITSSTQSYTVTLGGVTYTFKLICEGKYEVFNFTFLNKLGGFESREFTKVSRKTISITKTEYGKLPYTIDASGNVNYYNAGNVYNETTSVYASQFKEKMTLNSDILSDAEYTWLGEMMVSPLVYVKIGGYFIPCRITATNYEYRKQINDHLTNLTIDIEFGETYSTQFR